MKAEFLKSYKYSGDSLVAQVLVREGERLSLEEVDVAEISSAHPTPFYIYNLSHVGFRVEAFREAIVAPWKGEAAVPQFSFHYAMKANSHPRILREIRQRGGAIDAVSWPEAQLAIDCGFRPSDIVFSGVGKTVQELESALLSGIQQINVESLPELHRLIEIAQAMADRGLLPRPVSLGLRYNPDIPVETHPYITTGLRENKFGLEESAVREAADVIGRHPSIALLRGLSLHLGSQIFELGSLADALERARKFHEELAVRHPAMDRMDVGGGLGVDYQTEEADDGRVVEEFAHILHSALRGTAQLREVLFEPGRWIVARSGLLISEIQYVKKTSHKTFLIIDAGMTHLLRPALYQAKHRILPLRQDASRTETVVDVVGPICESSDVLARDLSYPSPEPGERLAIADAGAYGYVMSSNYNLRGLPGEFFIE